MTGDAPDRSLPTPVMSCIQGIDHEVIACDPNLADTAAFCEAYGFDPGESANAILIESKRPRGHLALCIVLASHRLDVNGAVCSTMGVKKASFASPETTRAVTGMEIGGVTPFGLPDDLDILIDADVMEVPKVIVGAGHRAAKLRVPTTALSRLPRTQVVPGLARPADSR